MKKTKKGKKVIVILLCAVIVIAAVIAAANYLALQHLVRLGNSYDKVEQENQLTPEKDESGKIGILTAADAVANYKKD